MISRGRFFPATPPPIMSHALRLACGRRSFFASRFRRRRFTSAPTSGRDDAETRAEQQFRSALDEWKSMSKEEKNKASGTQTEFENLSEQEKLRDPDYLRSPMKERGAMLESDRLLDNAFTIEPAGQHSGTLVWLHGLGHGVGEMRNVFELLDTRGLRVVVPHAPLIPITALDEDEDRTWYDLESGRLSEEDEEDRRGINSSTQAIMQLLSEEVALLEVAREAHGAKSDSPGAPYPLVVAGFGQGGAMAIHCGLRLDVPITAVLSFSGYVVQPELVPTMVNPANQMTQVLAIHGKSDPVVPYDFAVERYKSLQEMKVQFDFWEDFHMGHYIGSSIFLRLSHNDQMMGQMQWWLVDTLNNARRPFFGSD